MPTAPSASPISTGWSSLQVSAALTEALKSPASPDPVSVWERFARTADLPATFLAVASPGQEGQVWYGALAGTQVETILGTGFPPPIVELLETLLERETATARMGDLAMGAVAQTDAEGRRVALAVSLPSAGEATAEQYGFLAVLLHAVSARLDVLLPRPATIPASPEVPPTLMAKALAQTCDPAFITDRRERIVYVNRAFADLTGFAPPELLGQSIRFLSPQRGGVSDLTDHVMAAVAADGSWRGAMPLRCKDGTITSTDASYSIIQAEGRTIGCLALHRRSSQPREDDQCLSLYKSLVDAAPDPILVFALDGTLAYANAAGIDLFGPTLAENLHEYTLKMLIAPEDRREFERRVFPVMRAGDWSGDLHVISRDGSSRPVSVSSGVLRNAIGVPWVTFAILRDMAERQKLQRQVSESERRYRTIVHSVPTCIILLSPDGTIEEINHSPPPHDHRPPSAWRGQHVTKLPLLGSAPMRAAIRRLSDGEPIRMDVFRTRDRDGVGVTCSVRGVPLVGESGQEGAVLLIEDITERLAAEERDTLLASITQWSNDAIVSIDAEGTIQSWNGAAETLFGYPSHEMLGQSWTRLVPKKRRGEWNRILGLAGTETGSLQVETAVLTREKEEEPVEVTVSALRDRLGERVGSALMIRSVAERKRLEQRLRQAERLAAMGQMAAGIAHEINNPLTSIKNSFYIVRNALPKGDRSSEFAQIIDSEIDRISGIVNCLLDCYRPRVHEWTRVDMASVVGDILALVETEARRRNIVQQVRIPEALPLLFSSEQSVKQVLMNLMLNAIQSMENGGRLTVEVTAVDGMIRTTVEDTGCGIAPEHMSHIFDPFFTTKKKTSTTEGMGLGLSVSQGIVDTLGGYIEVESTVGVGSRFTVVLPIDATTGHRESHEQGTYTHY